MTDPSGSNLQNQIGLGGEGGEKKAHHTGGGERAWVLNSAGLFPPQGRESQGLLDIRVRAHRAAVSQDIGKRYRAVY